MLENLDVEFMRLQIHGSDSSLKFLQEADTKFDLLFESQSAFVITKQRDVGAVYVDKLTLLLTDNSQKEAVRKSDAFELRVGANLFRYVSEGITFNPISDGSLLVYANLRANFQDKTPIDT